MVRRVERMFCATIICGPVKERWVLKMWSWVLFVRPSKRRFMPRSMRPHAELSLLGFDFLEDEVG